MRTVTVYGLRSVGSSEVRYVGQTSQTLTARLRSHLREAPLKRRRPSSRWICEVQSRGGAIEIVPLEIGAERNVAETAWISRLRMRGARLLNVTDGGDQAPTVVGSAVGGAKLTDALAAEIIASPERGDVLARRFGVSKATVSLIRSGRTWTHLGHRVHRDGRKNLRRFFDGEVPNARGRELARRYESGDSRDVLAAEYGTTLKTITGTLKALGVDRRPGGATRRPLILNGTAYPGVLAAMRGERLGHGAVLREAQFL